MLKWFEDMIDLKTAHSKRQSKQTSTYLKQKFWISIGGGIDHCYKKVRKRGACSS